MNKPAWVGLGWPQKKAWSQNMTKKSWFNL